MDRAQTQLIRHLFMDCYTNNHLGFLHVWNAAEVPFYHLPVRQAFTITTCLRSGMVKSGRLSLP